MSKLNIHSNSHPSVFDNSSPSVFDNDRSVLPSNEQPEVQEENSVSPETTVDEELEAFRKQLEKSGVPADKIDRAVEIHKISQKNQPEQLKPTSNGPVDAAHMIQGSVDQRLRKKLEENYDELGHLQGSYIAKNEILNRALRSAGVTKETSPDQLEQIVKENPDIIRKFEEARDVGEAYKRQINKTGRALQDAQNAGIDTRDIMADWLHDSDKLEEQPESLHPEIQSLSQKIAETVTKFLGFIKRKLGFGKKLENKQPEAKQEDLDLSKTAYGPKPYLG